MDRSKRDSVRGRSSEGMGSKTGIRPRSEGYILDMSIETRNKGSKAIVPVLTEENIDLLIKEEVGLGVTDTRSETWVDWGISTW